jgi:hypothetical protein
MISQAYLHQQKQLHKTGEYGVTGHKWAPHIQDLCRALGTTDVLDYGCGQRTLEKALGFGIHNYDPCIDGLDGVPAPAELVVCGDVLEHIEPDFLAEVLDDLRRVTKRLGFFVIANRPAKKILPDGRNAHLIQEGAEWWFPKIAERFNVNQFVDMGGEMLFVVRAK